MTNKIKYFAATSGIAIAALAATPAFAVGTTAGSFIDNTATVNYQVGGVSQTAVNSNTNRIVVDRRISLLVAEVGNATTSVAPG